MPVVHLTDVSVRGFKSDRPVSYMDATTRGFGVRVGKHTKTWVVVRGRRRERLSFGKYPDLSLSAARTEAKRLLTQEPPTAPRISFHDARANFLNEHYRGKAGRTKAEAKRLLEKHFADLDKMLLSEIDDAHIKASLDRLTDRPSLSSYTPFVWLVASSGGR
jgi:hypothetical protein